MTPTNTKKSRAPQLPTQDEIKQARKGNAQADMSKREQNLKAKYPHIILGTLRYDEGVHKYSVEAKLACGHTDRLYTSDLFQVKACKACKKAKGAAKLAELKARTKDAAPAKGASAPKATKPTKAPKAAAAPAQDTEDEFTAPKTPAKVLPMSGKKDTDRKATRSKVNNLLK